MAELVEPLQQQIKDMGLWAVFLDEELGGPGYGQLKLGLLNEILGRYPSAPQMFGAAAPDTGNMEMLAAYGTEEQKERWLVPLINQEMFSAYSMTEPQGGSDPNLFVTNAFRDGDTTAAARISPSRQQEEQVPDSLETDAVKKMKSLRGPRRLPSPRRAAQSREGDSHRVRSTGGGF